MSIFTAMIDMDADVISLDAARSQMAVDANLAKVQYPNEVGPVVWDIHPHNFFEPKFPRYFAVKAKILLVVAKLRMAPICSQYAGLPEFLKSRQLKGTKVQVLVIPNWF